MVIIESQTNFQTQPNRNLVGTPRLPSFFWSGDDARDQWKDSECRGWSRKGEVFVGPPEAGRFSGCSPDHVGSPTINHPSWPCGATVRRKKGWWPPKWGRTYHPSTRLLLDTSTREAGRLMSTTRFTTLACGLCSLQFALCCGLVWNRAARLWSAEHLLI